MVTPASVSVTLGGDAESFERSNHMLIEDALTGDLGVGALLFFSQRFFLGFFLRQRGVGVGMLCALISGVKHGLRLFFHAHARVLQQLEVVTFALGGVDAQNAPCGALHNHLRLQRVAFLFARVEVFLFFFGRSHGVSVASTSTTSKDVLAASNAFLPGK